QITDLENTRAAKAARMQEIATKAANEGRTMDAAEAEEDDTLRDEVKKVDEDIVRYRDLAEIQKAAAKPAKGESPADAAKSRQPGGANGATPSISVREPRA